MKNIFAMRLVFIAMLFLIQNRSLAQTDYLITIKGDTLYGEIKLLVYDLMDRIELKKDKQKKQFMATQVI